VLQTSLVRVGGISRGRIAGQRLFVVLPQPESKPLHDVLHSASELLLGPILVQHADRDEFRGELTDNSRRKIAAPNIADEEGENAD
jgi:hypothetical protein